MTITVEIDDALLSELRDDERLSGSDQEWIIMALRTYLRLQAGIQLIEDGG